MVFLHIGRINILKNRYMCIVHTIKRIIHPGTIVATYVATHSRLILLYFIILLVTIPFFYVSLLLFLDYIDIGGRNRNSKCVYLHCSVPSYTSLIVLSIMSMAIQPNCLSHNFLVSDQRTSGCV